MLIRADSVVVGTAGWCGIDCCHSWLLIHCQVAILTQNKAEFDGKNKKATNNCVQWGKKRQVLRECQNFLDGFVPQPELKLSYSEWDALVDVLWIHSGRQAVVLRAHSAWLHWMRNNLALRWVKKWNSQETLESFLRVCVVGRPLAPKTLFLVQNWWSRHANCGWQAGSMVLGL